MSDSANYIVARDYDHLVTLFYSDVYFKAYELAQDETIAKAMAKKVFEIAQPKFNEKHNSLEFLEGILHGMTAYLKGDEEKQKELRLPQ